MRVWAGVVAAVVGGAAVLTLTGAVLAHASSPPGQIRATVRGYADTPSGRLPHAYLDLAAYPDSMAGEHGKHGGAHPDWVSFGPSSNLSVPAHSLVTVTIAQYDTGGAIMNPYFAGVHGTVDGTAIVDGKPVTSVDPNAIGHTFTVHMLPTGQPDLFVSVPLPAVDDNAPNLANGYPAPHLITFSFVTGAPGSYVWNCEYPCGDGFYAKFGGPMATQGYMSGTLTVA